MKMKSKFFSINAKLALAVLAVSTMFASCYDSENGDVTKPYTPQPAAYYVAGTITDVETGEALNNAIVKVNGALVELTDGSYLTSGIEGTNTVEVTCDDYKPATRKVTIPKVAAGQVYTAVVSVALAKESTELDVEVKLVSSVPVTQIETRTKDDNIGLDLIAEDEPATFTRKFEVEAGSVLKSKTPAPSQELDAYITEYLGANFGEFNPTTIVVSYTFTIPTWNWLKAVNIQYTYMKTNYNFKSADEECDVTLNTIAGYLFSTEFEPNHNFSHSHGHGHGHGDGNVNAGGGILTPEL